MRRGVRASNEQDDFSQAGRCFSAVLAMPRSTDTHTHTHTDTDTHTHTHTHTDMGATLTQLKDALFNMASLLHMHGFVALVVPLLERLLLLEGGAADLTAHAFLWSLAQGCVPTQQHPGEAHTCSADGTSLSSYLHTLVVGVYRRLGVSGDVLAAHKYRALTGHSLREGEGEGVGDKHGSSAVSSAVTEKGDPQYASLIFDNMAEVFEKRLVQDLKYDCPWRMKRLMGAC